MASPLNLRIPTTSDPRELNRWHIQLKQYLDDLSSLYNGLAKIKWDGIDYTDSDLTDLETRNHSDLQSINSPTYYHLTQVNHDDLTDGGATVLHKHSHIILDDIGTNTHTQIDSHINANQDIHGVGSTSSVVGTNTIQTLANKTINGFTGGLSTTTDTAYSVLATDVFVIADATSNVITVNLPAASSSSGRQITVIKSDGSGNAVTLDGASAETINGATTLALTAQYNKATIFCDGVEWFILAS
jgi:hypothetical protein